MTKDKKEKLLEIIEKRLENSGIGYLENYPEDDCESRRDWDSLHSDWSDAIYGLLEMKRLLIEVL